MSTPGLHVSIPDPLSHFIHEQVMAGAYHSPDEYVAALISADQKRLALESIEEYLQKGLDSGPPIEVTEEFWQLLHNELDQR